MKETYEQAKARLSKRGVKRSSSFVKMFDPTDETAIQEIAELRKSVKMINKTIPRNVRVRKLFRVVTEYRLPLGSNRQEAAGYYGPSRMPHFKRKDAVLGLLYIQQYYQWPKNQMTIREELG